MVEDYSMNRFFIVGACSIFTLPVFAAQLSDQEKKEVFDKTNAFRVMTYNVCNMVGIYKKPELRERFAWSVRKNRIFKQIIDESPDIIGFQEIRNEPEGSVLADLWQGLGSHGYEFITFRNNPSDLSLFNTIGYKFKKFALDKINRWWASETPDKFSDSWGNGYGRVALMATFFPTKKVAVGKDETLAPNYDQLPIHMVNVHHGMKHDERLNSNKVLVNQVAERSGNKSCVVVVTGDFNDWMTMAVRKKEQY